MTVGLTNRDQPKSDLAAFRRQAGISMPEICREVFAHRSDAIQVQSEKIAVRNLGRIIEATLAIANRRGFAAMSLRDLAKRTGLSLGGLYAYIQSKDDLVSLIQQQCQRVLRRVMAQHLEGIDTADRRLAVAIRTHLYLSEALRPWFVFLYMEARHLGRAEREQGYAMEQASEKLFADIIADGQADGVFRNVPPAATAGMLKALLQDWYLKHRKHSERGLDVADYTSQVQALMHSYLQV